MNSMIDLSSNKRENIIENTINVIIDKCTHMIKYLLMIIKIDVAKLTKLFCKKIVLYFNISIDIDNEKNFLFTSVF